MPKLAGPSLCSHAANTVFRATAGGGLEDGESYEDAALREVREETGFDVELGPVVWTREKTATMQNGPLRFVERYFIARTATAEISDAGQEAYEKQFMRDHRWWTLEELRAADDLIFPEGIADLLAPILAGNLPARPVKITQVTTGASRLGPARRRITAPACSSP